MDDDTREFKQLLFEALARADRIDFPKTNADTFVLEAARKLFLAQGEVPCTVILRSRKGAVAIIVNPPYELAHLRPAVIRAAAQLGQAQALYVVSETWVVNEDVRINGLEPRHHEQRTEAMTVWAENPLHAPPVRSWNAVISRDAAGRPSLGEWKVMHSRGGRLLYLLPPEAYVAPGQPVPKA